MIFCSCKKNSTGPTLPSNTLLYDGFTYHTITIPGAGTWTVENARNTHFRNGDPIRKAQISAEWKDSTNKKIAAKTSDTGAWCSNTNITDDQIPYGNLYNWCAIKDARGFAPAGWRVATEDDFTKLKNALGNSAGHKLKSKRYWEGDADSTKPNRDQYGFSALPTGYCETGGSFNFPGIYANFWSVVNGSNNAIIFQRLDKASALINEVNNVDKLFGCSVARFGLLRMIID